MKSALDKLSAYLAPAIRTMGDFEIDLTGTETCVVRIKKETVDAWAGNSSEHGKRDVFGDADERAVGAAIIDNIIINYNGYDKIEAFGKAPGKTSPRLNVKDPEKPIEFLLRISGQYLENPVSLGEGDLLVDHFIDERGAAIPVYLQVGPVSASFFAKHLVAKQGVLVPYHGRMEKSIRQAIEVYVRKIRAGLL